MPFRNVLTMIALGLFTLVSLPERLIPAGWAQATVDQLEEQAVQNAVAHVSDSVVRIETLGGLEKVAGRLVGTGPGTGLCIAPDGYIISSAFHFVQQPTSILVTLPDGSRAPARMVARDNSRMLVLLKVETEQELPIPEISPRSEWSVGQWTIAVGRTYATDSPNVSVGILSATNRIWGRAVQTDAKISPGNYGGPLIDIRGRVIGVLVPLSPQETGVMAGTEWYDSGIGFAVPLEDILRRLPDMKKGTDLYRGILGVSFKGSDIYTLPAKIAACPAKSPAYEAGLRVGDTIVEVNGQAITRRAQLLHALGPQYAGDVLQMVAERDGEAERVKVTVELTDKLEPYVRPFLGILPERNPNASEPGVRIRFVIPDSPASQAGLKRGARIVAVENQPVEHATSLRETIARMSPNDKISLKLQSSDPSQLVTVQLAQVPDTIPADLPAVQDPDPDQVAVDQPPGIVKISLPEQPKASTAYVPADYQPTKLYGLLVWLPVPGAADIQKIVDRWKPVCERRGLILLVPQAHDNRRWLPTEVDYIQQMVDEVLNRYSIDAARIAIGGEAVSGTMAFLVAFQNRTVFRGVASLNGALPQRMEMPSTDPLQPLHVFSLSFQESDQATRIQAGEQALRQLAFPVVSQTLPGDERPLSDQEHEELARWFDLLDRI